MFSGSTDVDGRGGAYGRAMNPRVIAPRFVPSVALTALFAVLALAGCDRDQPSTGPQAQASTTDAVSATTQPPPPTSEATTSPATTYDCAALLSNGEAQAATGLDLSLVESADGADDPFDGYTDCGYFSSDGTYMQATVWTGPAYEQGFVPQLEAGRAGAADPVPGVGDEAGWSADLTVLGVRVGGTGITIAFAFVDERGQDELRTWAVELADIVISHL